MDSHRERNLLHAEPSAIACWRVSQLLKISARTSARKFVGNVIVDSNLGEKKDARCLPVRHGKRVNSHSPSEGYLNIY